MFGNVSNANKEYTWETKLKLFLKWAGLIFFGLLSGACLLAVPFLAPVLASSGYIWLVDIAFFVLFSLFAFITYRIYKLKIEEKLVTNIQLSEEKLENNDKEGKKNEQGINNDINGIKNNEKEKKDDINKNIVSNNDINNNESKDNPNINEIKNININNNINNNSGNKLNDIFDDDNKIDSDKSNKNEKNIKETRIDGTECEMHIYDVNADRNDVDKYLDILDRHENLNVLFGNENKNLENRGVKIKYKSADRIAQLWSDSLALPEIVTFNLYKEENKEK